MFNEILCDDAAIKLGAALQARHWMIATAESCTGGGIAEAITSVAGSSAWFDCAFITYSYEAKVRMLGVEQASLDQHGAVSQAVVEQMAQGALNRSRANVAIAVSGIAGPAGGTADKPVGTVWIAWASRAHEAEHSSMISASYLFKGDRQAVRLQTVMKALGELLHNLW